MPLDNDTPSRKEPMCLLDLITENENNLADLLPPRCNKEKKALPCEVAGCALRACQSDPVDKEQYRTFNLCISVELTRIMNS